MTWSRLSQSGFESGGPNEGNFWGAIFGDPVDADTNVSGYFNADGFGSDSVIGHMGTGHTQMRVGFLCRPHGSYIQDVRFFEFFCQEADGTSIFEIKTEIEHRWLLRYRDPTDGSYTTLATADIYVDGYNHADCLVAFGFTIDIGPNPFLSFYMNGERIISYTDGLLSNALNVYGFHIHRSLLFDANSTMRDFDDIYCDTSDGTEPDAVPPTLRLPFVRPAGDGALTEWTLSTGVNHYAVIDDYPPDDTDYAYVTVADQTELYDTETFTLPTYYEIQAVIPMARAKKGNAQVDSEFSLVVYNPSLVAESVSTPVDLGLGYEYYFGRFTTEPATSLSWVAALVNAMHFGYRSRGTL